MSRKEKIAAVDGLIFLHGNANKLNLRLRVGMTHSVRLNLRMQKELKLLLSDPPPGVTITSNVEDGSSVSSLSKIEAWIKGPEGTAYEKGVFRVRVQVPERYPFHPPIVTFLTQVYHPNIDDGGRICLDILNLPPKGAWQPSLNISTVLTSIVLLLSEPNPDDGLMCDASREYKYDRQKFEQKARFWTEKYASPGADDLMRDDVLKAEASSSRPIETIQNNAYCQRKCRLSGKGKTGDHEKVQELDRQNHAEVSGKSSHNFDTMNCDVSVEEIKYHIGKNLCEEDGDGSKGAIIVADSEGSDEEDRRSGNFRLSLRLRRKPGKRKLEGSC
ncbi:uncharacterized protein LOC144712388 [Wolffia australiana]